MFLDNKYKLLKRSEDNKYDYILYVSTKEECDLADNGKLESPYEIIANGETKSMTEYLSEKLMPVPRFINNLLTKSLINSYKCWACESLGIDQHIAHMSAIDSWQCLIDTIGHPEYVIIIQKPIEDVKDETI